MDHSQRIAELERKRAELTQNIERDEALRIGIDAELNHLLRTATPLDDLIAARLTEAIIATLRWSAGPMSPTDIQTELHNHGRDETLRKITATLNHLRKRGLATKAARACWRAGSV